jgi:peptidoglycan/LPS O-acetylase OafA/YrhL
MTVACDLSGKATPAPAPDRLTPSPQGGPAATGGKTMRQVDSTIFAHIGADADLPSGTIRPPTGTRHFPELQSVRGLAALVVLLYHCLIYYNTGPALQRWTETILNAHAAVVMFFVLSGFVLTGALRSKPLSPGSYVRYGIRRAARIYPALWIAVLVALAYLHFGRMLPPPPDRSTWLLGYDTHVVNAGDIAGSLLGARDMLVPPLWSIKVELLASLAIPLLAWLSVRKAGLWPLGVVAALLAMVSMAAGLNTMYLVDFAFGAIAMACVGTGAKRIRFRHSYMLLFLLLAGLAFFRDANTAWSFDTDYHAPLPGLAEGLFSATFLFTLLSSEMQGSLLLVPLLVWLGDISYSVYLLHFPVMESAARIMPAILPGLSRLSADARAFLLAGATLLVVLPLAHFSYRWIELPAIVMGKKLLARLSQRGAPARARSLEPRWP